MKNLTDSFIFLGHWPSTGSFGFNTDILATNLINLNVVLGVLIFFGKGVYNLLQLSYLLDNQKERILSTIRNSEELCRGAFRVNGYSEIEQKKMNLINSVYQNLEQLENYKNETIHFKQQRAINQVQQRVFQQALQGSLGTLNNCLNGELYLRTIGANICILGAMKEITD
ncbi:unnamed protein product [Victoria cruziana]